MNKEYAGKQRRATESKTPTPKKIIKNENNSRSFGSEDNITMKNAAFFLETNTVRKTTIYLIYADAIMT